MPAPSRALLVATLAVPALAGCAADDPVPEVPTFTQEAIPDAIDEAADDTGEAAVGAAPGPPEGFTRPDDLVDLTGMDTVEIEVADNVFRTRNFVVDAGTEIVFVNVGANPHNVKPSVAEAFTASPDFESGEAVALRLDDPGDYPFYCSIHGGPTFGQTGYVVVAAT